ncbi:MAG: dihydroneopterin aldolase [Erythrobacter sp.]|uniref:dihydroneopterin aldolase n=1 Tax=Erythrobacter sp. TaxID=1042 RepID=UPI00263554A7|nr:dihydroneopterin aldolase [Erythrobacter sp.]MDJ0979762.1 dihydroneopterin aldolase [Erythrobacter sp.]
MRSAVVLEGLELTLDLGTYAPGDVKPDAHLLDMTLTIDPALALVPGDAMRHVFDYDPLIAEIDRLARDGHYETQEWLMTRIARACAAYAVIEAVELKLYKRPVLRGSDGQGSGTLGVTLSMDRAELDTLAGH